MALKSDTNCKLGGILGGHVVLSALMGANASIVNQGSSPEPQWFEFLLDSIAEEWLADGSIAYMVELNILITDDPKLPP